MTAEAMKSNYTYSLVKEAYALEEARELLMSLVTGTTRFYSLNSLRIWERTGAKDEPSEKRIEELEELRESILKLLKDVEGENLAVEINTEIKVTAKKT